ncbi:ferredoxin [Mycolicibacterium sp. P9-64]|uniref:NAD(P)/FAD-dependent oxidoreductase n=1 Tax=Mycolicibacterium sp. P9-64 TaxID=2024612 RepID=UPI0011EFD66E|nr:FAD-dependent oxidoreductase [Mycolicibacterium sp. P9-64]KAA0085206.1 ferredoxin [Mycolicibacterium sp. P9-64]
MTGTLVVGASQAGVQLAVSLRDCGDDEPITLIGDESHVPYQRPPLSKAYLHGTTDLDQMVLRAPDYLADRDITLITGDRVDRISMAANGSGGEAVTSSGRRLAFDRLALTVGARPRLLTVPGSDVDGVRYLRTADDAITLRDLQADATSIVVVGGGFIGLEAAAVARAQGKTVTVVEAGERLIGRAVAPVVSEFYLAAHRGRGVDVRLGTQIVEVQQRDSRISGVVLSDGTRIAADLMIVGIGVEPCTELAEQLGLELSGGIVVDQFARTNLPGVVAAGDCTVQPHPLGGEGSVRLESVQNAVSQAKTAAATLAGRHQPNVAVPWFWSDQYDLKLQIAGLSRGYDHYVVRGDVSAEAFSVLYYCSGQLLAVDAVNAGADYMAVRKALTQGATIPADAAADAATPLRDCIIPAAIGA